MFARYESIRKRRVTYGQYNDISAVAGFFTKIHNHTLTQTLTLQEITATLESAPPLARRIHLIFAERSGNNQQHVPQKAFRNTKSILFTVYFALVRTLGTRT